jgi:hypothetical protein
MADATTPAAPNTEDTEFINLGYETLRQRAAEFAAEQAYKAERMRLIDVPMTQLERDKLAYQASVTAADNAYRDRKFAQVDLPQLQLAFQQEGRAGLQQMLDGRLKEYGLKLEGEKVEDMMNRTALASAELQMNDALSRDKMASLDIPALKLDATKVQQAGLTAALDDYYRVARLNGIEIPEEQRKYIETGMTGMQQAASIAAQYASMGLTAQEIQAKLQQQGMQGYQSVADTAVKYAQMGQQADQIQDQLMNTSLKSLVATGELGAKYAAMGLDAQTVQNATQQLGMQAIQASMQDNIATAGVQTSQAELALKAAGQSDQTAIQALQLAASLSGPKNAFQQQQVMWGLNQQGLSRAVGAISGKYDLPTTQANQANPEAAGLGSLGQDILNAGGQTTGPTGSDVANQIASQYLNRGTGGWNPNDVNRQTLEGYGNQQLTTQVAAPVAPDDTMNAMKSIAQRANEYVASRPDMDPALKQQMLDLAAQQAGAQVGAPDANANAALSRLIQMSEGAGSTQLQNVYQDQETLNQLADANRTAADIAANAAAQNTGQDALALAKQVGNNAANNQVPVLGSNADIEAQLQKSIADAEAARLRALGNAVTTPTPTPGTPTPTPTPGTPTPGTPGQPVQPKNLDDLESLSAIWKARPDLAAFFTSKGWDLTQPEQKLAATMEWAKLASAGADPLWVAAGGDVTKVAQMNGWAPEPTIWQPARALQGVEQRLGDPFVAWVSGAPGGDEFDYKRGVQLGGKGQKLWGPDWRWETATTAQKLQLSRQWVTESADGISFYQDPIYALRELGGMADQGGPAWMTPQTQMQQNNAVTKAPTTLAQVPSIDDGSRHMAQKWIMEGGNPQMKASLQQQGKLSANPTIEEATAAFKDWYKWQSGMGGIQFPAGQQFKLVDGAQQTGWVAPIVAPPPIGKEVGGLTTPKTPPPPVLEGPNVQPQDQQLNASDVMPQGQTATQPLPPALPQFGTDLSAPTTAPVVGAGATVATPQAATVPTPTTPVFGAQPAPAGVTGQPVTQPMVTAAQPTAATQPAAFLPSATEQAATLPGGKAGPPIFGSDSKFAGPSPDELAAQQEAERKKQEALAAKQSQMVAA